MQCQRDVRCRYYEAAMSSPLKTTVYTVGHSNQTMEAFTALLIQSGVSAIADVRSVPYSRYNPQFNREALERSLRDHGISYVYLGKELGARSDDPSCYKDGQVQFPMVARTPLFRLGIDRVILGSTQYRIALMCAEKDPLNCHRSLLVSRDLNDRGVDVVHILSDGQTESYDASMSRLMDEVGVPEEDLYLARQDLIAAAIAKKAGQVAYEDETLAVDADRDTP